MVCIFEIFVLGGERCYRELRDAHQPLRAHSIIPSTHQPLHNSSARNRDDGVTGEDSGPSTLSSCTFDEGNEREANQCVGSFQINFLVDYRAEKFMKRLVGKTEVEDGLQRLDMLTKEENLMAAACTLKVAGVIRRDVDVIRDYAREIKEDTHDIEEDTRDIKNDTRDIKDDTRNINDNLEINKRGPPHPFNFFIFVLIFPYHMLIAIEELQSLLLLDTDRH